MARFTPPPIISPPIGQDGRFNQTWALWLQQLYQRAGGAVNDNLDSMALESVFDPGQDTTVSDVDQGSYDSAQDTSSQIDDAALAGINACQCPSDRSEDVDYALQMAAFPDVSVSPDKEEWKDIIFPITDRATGVGRPTYATFMGNITAPRFAINDYAPMESTEFPHDWKQGSDFYIHVHFTTNGTDATIRYLKWEVEYSYVVQSSYPTETPHQWATAVVVSAEAAIPANTPDRSEYILPIATVGMPTGLIGGQWRMNVKRIAASSTAPTNDPFLSQVGIHYLVDSLGSRSIGSK